MLPAGFTTLDYLKSQILPKALAEDTDNTDYDDRIAVIGRGVAARFNSFCARKFERLVNAEDEFDALSFAWVLQRYPVETISAIVVQSRDGSTSTLSAGEWKLSKSSGLVELDAGPGSRLDSVVVSYTGGYWLDDGGTMPDAATPLPDDVLSAFVEQVQAVCEHRELFRTAALRKEDRTPGEAKITDLELIKDVTEVLESYRRFGGL